MFEKNIRYAQSINDYKLEDINSQLSIANNEKDKMYLENRRQILLSDKYIERLKNAFNQSPVLNTNEFYAAKIVHVEPNIKVGKSYGLKKIIILFGIFGLILGVIVTLISTAIDLRKTT